MGAHHVCMAALPSDGRSIRESSIIRIDQPDATEIVSSIFLLPFFLN
jgi:hypothetical protein